VNLSFSKGSVVEIIPEVESVISCGSDPGWYFGAELKELRLCPATCQDFIDSPETIVELIEGCTKHHL